MSHIMFSLQGENGRFGIFMRFTEIMSYLLPKKGISNVRH